MFKTCGNYEYSGGLNDSKTMHISTPISLKNNVLLISPTYAQTFSHMLTSLMDKHSAIILSVKNKLSTFYTVLTTKITFLNLIYKYNNKEEKS